MIRGIFSARGRTAPALLSLCLGVAALGGCTEDSAPGNGARADAAAGPCQDLPVTLASPLPTNSGRGETNVDCAAWATFIALNWRADPAKPGYPDPAATAANFGTPGDMSPTVWESYLEASTVFGPRLQGMWQAKRPAVKPLNRTSKFGDLDLTDVTQAGSGNHWLTNQRGEITYYEVMMNRDEFEFITAQKGFDLTTAAGQLACASEAGKPPAEDPGSKVRLGGLAMPSGHALGWDDTDCTGAVKVYGDDVGAMEIKAAWTPLPADGSLNYRYKTATAEIQDPGTKATRTVTVGLVGLHIIRKSPGMQQWTWSTFEHIDNSPDEGGANGFTPPQLPANANQRPSPGFTFFNPTCNPQTDKAFKCVHNAPPSPCLLGTNPATCQPYNAPMQITRLNPVSDAANSVTAYVWSLLAAQAPQSVFNYYRLIGVQWPQKTVRLTARQTSPLPMGDPTPQGVAGGVKQILANTTMESFQQASHSCLDCHAPFTTIATPNATQAQGRGGLRRPARGGTDNPVFASDYSFLFATETQR